MRLRSSWSMWMPPRANSGASGRTCRRKASVEWFGPGNDRTVGRRMSGDNYPLGDETLDLDRGKTVEAALDEVAAIPVLLSLAALALRPSKPSKLRHQARKDDRDRREKAPPMACRSAGVHRRAVGTAPALYPGWLREAVKVARDVAVPPQPLATTARAPLWPRPWVELPLAYDLGHTGRHG